MKTFIPLFLLVLFALQSHGQIKISLSKDSIIVGNPTYATVEIKTQKNQKIIKNPQFSDSIPAKLEILHQTPLQQKDLSQYSVYSYGFYISGYDSGTFTIPPIIASIDSSGTIKNILSDSITLKINTLPVDTAKTEGIKDIYEIDAPSSVLHSYWGWIIALFLLTSIGFGWYFFFYRKKRILKADEKTNIPPFDEAIQALRVLAEKRSWNNDNGRVFYSELTDIIRRYLWREYNINALEMTSSELLTTIEYQFAIEEILQKAKGILRTADLVKFAKHKAQAVECEHHLSEAKSLIECLKPQQNVEETQQSKEL